MEDERGGGGGRRAQRGALMAFGRLRVSRSGAREARRSQGDGTARAGAASGAGGAVLDGGRRGEQCRACCAWAYRGLVLAAFVGAQGRSIRKKGEGKGKEEDKGKEEKGEKEKGGAGGIHGDGREPVVVSTRSNAHEKQGDWQSFKR